MFLGVFFHADHVDLTNTSDSECRRCRWRGGGEERVKGWREIDMRDRQLLLYREMRHLIYIYIKETESNNNTLQS